MSSPRLGGVTKKMFKCFCSECKTDFDSAKQNATVCKSKECQSSYHSRFDREARKAKKAS